MKWFEKYNKFVMEMEGLRIPEFFKNEKFEPLWKASFKSESRFRLYDDPRYFDFKVEDFELVMVEDLDKLEYPFYCSLSDILYPQERRYGGCSYVANFGGLLNDRMGLVMIDQMKIQSLSRCNVFREVPGRYLGFIARGVEIKEFPSNLEEWPSTLLAHFIFRKLNKTTTVISDLTREISLQDLMDSLDDLQINAAAERVETDNGDFNECFSPLNRSIVHLMAKRNILPSSRMIGDEWDKTTLENIVKEDREQEINNPIDVFRNYITV